MAGPINKDEKIAESNYSGQYFDQAIWEGFNSSAGFDDSDA
jgi:hypothetical protein